MRVDRKLLEKALRSPEALRFEEAVRLTRQLGFEKVRQMAGHRLFRHPPLRDGGDRSPRPLNLQEGPHGMAKAYQVAQLLRARGVGEVASQGRSRA